MATAFNYLASTARPQTSTNTSVVMEAQRASDEAQRALQAAEARRRAAYARTGGSPAGQTSIFAARDIDAANQAYNEALSMQWRASNALTRAQADAANAAQQAEVDAARNAMFGLTAGVSDQIMNDPRVGAALDRIQQGMNEGPYSDAVQAQLISRNADRTARAEAVQAEQLRNSLAARGVGPGDAGYDAAMRQLLSNRQTSNLAFAGDLQTNATLQNYQAQQDAARALAGTRLGQYGQAQPGYGQAAGYLANTQFTGGRTSGTGSGGMAFSTAVKPSAGATTQTSGGMRPASVKPMQRPTSSATQTAIEQSLSATPTSQPATNASVLPTPRRSAFGINRPTRAY